MVSWRRFNTCRQNDVCIENVSFETLSAQHPWHLPTRLNSCLFSETKRPRYSSLHQNRGIETEITFCLERTNRTILLKSYIALNLSSNDTDTRKSGLLCIALRGHSDTSRSFFLEWEMFQTNFVEKIKNVFYVQWLFIWKSCYIWDNVKD
jgi:hypothetical protein